MSVRKPWEPISDPLRIMAHLRRAEELLSRLMAAARPNPASVASREGSRSRSLAIFEAT
jgi:hypothetical protein